MPHVDPAAKKAYMKAYQIEWYAKNKAKKNAQNTAWRVANRDYAIALTKAWEEKNVPRCKANKAARKAADPEAFAEAARIATAKFRAADPVRSKERADKYRETHAPKAKVTTAAWRQANPGRTRAMSARRHAAILERTVSWSDHIAIGAVYKQAALAAAETGIPHDVDHFYPLQGKLVSGLHVAENLRVMTASANRRKSNKYVIT